MKLYNTALMKFPLLTKSITGALLFGVSEFLIQNSIASYDSLRQEFNFRVFFG